MDIWIPVLSSRLESESNDFCETFVGGKIIIKKKFMEDEKASTSSEWLIHTYYRPDEEFSDRPFIMDICFRFANRRREILSIFVENDTFLGHVRSKENNGRLIIAAKIKKLLCGLDIRQPSSSRRFIIQNFDYNLKENVFFYVNPVKLGFIGGDLFQKWKSQEETGVMTVNESFETSTLELLLEAVAKYDDIVVMRHTVDRLVLIARKYRMHKLMRAIEEYICETKLLNWDEKILLSLQYRMSPLYVQVQRKYLLSPWTILCRVQRLLISSYANATDAKNGNPYEVLHKHFLELVMMSEKNICIG